MRRFCTSELKVVPAMKVCRDLFGWERWTNLLGIRADEPKRVRPSRDRRWANAHPLVDLGVTVEDVDAFWREQDFDLRLPKMNGKNWLGNCDGCFLKSEESSANLYRLHPERAAWWDRMERETDGTFSKRFSRKELHATIDSQRDWIFSVEGALCQANDGECTDG